MGPIPGTASPFAREGSGPNSPPAITIPTGGGAVRGIGEKFAANPATGTASFTIPIAVSPGRAVVAPQIGLTYDSGAGNGPFGFGWSLSLPSITRKTDKGLPRYDDTGESDVFVLSGSEDLVPQLEETPSGWVRPAPLVRTMNGRDYLVRRYRPRVEASFARIELWTERTNAANSCWRSVSRDNVTTWYGRTDESRVADPADATRVFRWLICESHDDKGQVVAYAYKKENSDRVDTAAAHERNRTGATRSANRYLADIRYGNRTPYFPNHAAPAPVPMPASWCFEVAFDYGDHDTLAPLPDEPGRTWAIRTDPFSSYRAGFEIRTYRLCRRVLMFHHFPADASVGLNCLVASTDFIYSPDVTPADPRNPIYSFLASVTHSGYRRQPGGYLSRSLPPVTLEYTEPIVDTALQEIDPESLAGLPSGLDGALYRFADLDGEGAAGFIAEQAGARLYKRNLSPVAFQVEGGVKKPRAWFARAELLTTQPSMSGLAGGEQLLDLAGDGQLDAVAFRGPTPGFYERSDAAGWEPFRPFDEQPIVEWSSPKLRFVDLTGDGHADILITEDQALCWHESHGESGFGPAERIVQAFDEERGPSVAFADSTESIVLADLSGDGLVDLVRIRNGEVCYWPNLGYGRFGPKVTMDDAPVFDGPDAFDSRRVRLADIDGSGTTDIIYTGTQGVQLYFNQSGNGWGPARDVPQFPATDSSTAVTVIDLLGNGTACLVWSSPLPGRGGSCGALRRSHGRDEAAPAGVDRQQRGLRDADAVRPVDALLGGGCARRPPLDHPAAVSRPRRRARGNDRLREPQSLLDAVCLSPRPLRRRRTRVPRLRDGRAVGHRAARRAGRRARPAVGEHRRGVARSARPFEDVVPHRCASRARSRLELLRRLRRQAWRVLPGTGTDRRPGAPPPARRHCATWRLGGRR